MWFKRLKNFIAGYFNGSCLISITQLAEMNHESENQYETIEDLEEQVKFYKKALEQSNAALEHAMKYYQGPNHESFYEIPKEFMVTDEEVKS